jgi:hypothetical protein
MQCQCEATVTASGKGGGAATASAPAAGQRSMRNRDRDPNEPPPFCQDSLGADIRMVGGRITSVGEVVEVVGSAVTVVAPPAGGAISTGGGLLDFGGNLLTLSGYAVEGDWRGALGHVFDATVGRVSGRTYQRAATGAWRATSGRYTRNLLGGRFRQAKRTAAGNIGSHLSEEARESLFCRPK